MFCWCCYSIHHIRMSLSEAQSSFTLLAGQKVSYGGEATAGVDCNVGHWLLHCKRLRQTIIQYCKKRNQSIKKNQSKLYLYSTFPTTECNTKCFTKRRETNKTIQRKKAVKRRKNKLEDSCPGVLSWEGAGQPTKVTQSHTGPDCQQHWCHSPSYKLINNTNYFGIVFFYYHRVASISKYAPFVDNIFCA